MIVSNMQSRKGNPVPNQFILTCGKANGDGVTFQSYKSIIANIKNGIVTLDEYYWNYSRTTSKYLSLFLEESLTDIRAKIKDGTYLLANLN